MHTHCCYCRRRFDEGNKNLRKTRDHFVPKSRTGNDGENILECCFECNQWKADRTADFWLKRVTHYEKKRTLYGSYTLLDYRQIIGSIRHWTKFFKGKEISQYKF